MLQQPAAGRASSNLVLLLGVSAAMLAAIGCIVATVIFTGTEKPSQQITSTVVGDANLGRQATMRFGCVVCHSDDGSPRVGPSYKGLWGSMVRYEDGSTWRVDDAEIREAINEPSKEVVEGYDPRMPKIEGIAEADMQNIIAYMHAVGQK